MPTPTAEQQAAIDAFATGDDIVLQAGAGSGKTSTLRMLANAQPGKRGLYVAYNRAIKEDAARSFPSSVKCMTSHGLAFGTVGRRYTHRLGGSRQPANQVADILGITSPLHLGKDLAPLTRWQVARLALDAVKKFCFAADPELATRHVPRPAGYSWDQHKVLAQHVLPHAQTAWRDIVAIEGRLRFEHDHYLKIWALSEPRLNYDYLLFDEAQDANALVTGLILDQPHAQRIAVGDSSQAIYGWRGATDALATFPGKQLTLSQSFRFGPAVAEQANLWLDLLDAPLRLTGFEKISSRVEALHRPDAILTRTNAGAMAAAMRHMNNGLRVAIVGGGDAVRKMAYASIDLKAGRTTDHPELMAFTSWQQVQDYVQYEAEGSDLRPLVKLIDEHGPDAVIRAANGLVDERRAEITVSTAHKAKGREWATVQIGDDFHKPKPTETVLPSGEVREKTLVRRDEAMLAYVAVTRAREVLDNAGLAWAVDIDGIAP
jgi:hypothetical protein